MEDARKALLKQRAEERRRQEEEADELARKRLEEEAEIKAKERMCFFFFLIGMLPWPSLLLFYLFIFFEAPPSTDRSRSPMPGVTLMMTPSEPILPSAKRTSAGSFIP